METPAPEADRWHPRKLLPPRGAARPLTVLVLTQTTGFGLLTVLSVVYVTKFVGLSATQVGLALSIAAGLGLATGIPAGYLTDRVRPRFLLAVFLALQGVAVLGYLVVDSFLVFVVVNGAYQMADRAESAVRGGFIAKAVPAEDQVRVRGYLRAVANIGFGLGALLAGVALTFDSRAAFRTTIVVAAVGYLLAALAVRWAPSVAAVEKEMRIPSRKALRDWPYLSFLALNAVLSFHYSVLEVGMPLWVTLHTDAPPWMVTVLFLINTSCVVAFQVVVGTKADTITTAKRATVVSGGVLAVCCVVFGVAGEVVAVAAVALLLAAGLLHVLGEMLQTAASWTLAFELAPHHAQGQYQGMFSTSTSAGLMVGSSVVTIVAINNGLVGWLILGGLFLVTALLVPPAVRAAERGPAWVVRGRPAEAVPEASLQG